jgi:glycosyltransferase involved in cell wall biosynthesis
MSNNKSRVSIGLPVYNGENYLEAALDSILSQTYTDFELIISDNASTDRTQEICRTYMARDQRIRYHRNKENVGAAKNYNLVFAMTSGEYFKWLSHDDMCAPQLLERCVDILDREPSVVLCYPRTTFIGKHGEFLENYVDGFNLCSAKPHERLREFLDNRGWCHPVFGVIRASMLKLTPLIGNYPRSDRNLLGELALHGKFYEIPEHLFYRRIHPQMSTRTHVTERDLATWFDPTKRGKIVFPRWRRLFEYLRAISVAPLSWSERVHCYIQVGRFVLVPQKWSGLAADLFTAARLNPLKAGSSKK